jgi:hypothetical protein
MGLKNLGFGVPIGNHPRMGLCFMLVYLPAFIATIFHFIFSLFTNIDFKSQIK